jgi:8-oxo-dGTP pyrophosphatase MutT (NUDIX family)
MQHSIAAKYAAWPAARFVRPAGREWERRLGLHSSLTFQRAATRLTILRPSRGGLVVPGWRPATTRRSAPTERPAPCCRDDPLDRWPAARPTGDRVWPRLRGEADSATATSAGGIVYRFVGSVPQLVVGRRKRERDAHLDPAQGHADPGETLEETALREVCEETGLTVRILSPLDAINYTFVQRGTRIHKTVHYFMMEPTGGGFESHDHEFEEVRWISFDEAAIAAVVRDGTWPRRPGGDCRRRGCRTGPLEVAHTRRTARWLSLTTGDAAGRSACGSWGADGRVRGLADAAPVRRHPRGASGRARSGRALRPVAHGRALRRGPEAAVGLGRARHRPAALKVGRAQYSMICFPDGGILDDLIVYRLARSGSWSWPTPPTPRP